jgi:hypothetical protein
MPNHHSVGPLETPQRTLSIAKRSVEAAINTTG